MVYILNIKIEPNAILMMSAPTKKLVVVLGATGGQGNSVVKAFLKDDGYKVRGVTRDPKSSKAQALTKEGVEMVAGDLNDKKSLSKAFSGANTIFAVTDFFEPFGKFGAQKAIDIEFSQGQNIVLAASNTAGLQHFVWSTLPHASTLTNGKFNVPHFEAKNQIDDLIKGIQTLLAKTIFVWFGFYTENLFYPIFTPIYVVSLSWPWNEKRYAD